MTAIFWKGPGDTGTPYQGGDFETGANWSGGSVPDAGSSIFFSPGQYGVSLTSVEATVASMAVAEGVTLALVAGSRNASLTLNQDSVSYGTISLNNSALYMSDSATLVNFGSIVCSRFSLIRGAISNSGVISGLSGGGAVDVQASVHNEASGRIEAPSGSGISFYSNVTNDGVVAATDGGRVSADIYGPGVSATLTNLVGGDLAGGSWLASGGGLIQFNGDPITKLTDGASVELQGAGSDLMLSRGMGMFTSITASLTSIGSGSTLAVTGDRDFATDNGLTVDGTFQLGGGQYTSTALQQIASDGTLTGYGDIAARLLVNGTIVATTDASDPATALHFSGGVLLPGSLIGDGTAVIDGGTFAVKEGAVVDVAALTVDGGELLVDGADLAYAHRFTLASGSVELGGYDLTLSGRAILLGGEIDGDDGVLMLRGRATASTGVSEIDATVANKALVTVSGGELDLLGVVSGHGGFSIKGGGLLEFDRAVAKTETITFAGGGQLELGDVAHFKGRVEGLDAHGVLDLDGFASAGAKLGYKAHADGQGGLLKVTSGAGVASIHLDGVFEKSGFHLADDGHGGVEVSYAGGSPAASPTQSIMAGHGMILEHHGGWTMFADHNLAMGQHFLV